MVVRSSSHGLIVKLSCHKNAIPENRQMCSEDIVPADEWWMKNCVRISVLSHHKATAMLQINMRHESRISLVNCDYDMTTTDVICSSVFTTFVRNHCDPARAETNTAEKNKTTLTCIYVTIADCNNGVLRITIFLTKEVFSKLMCPTRTQNVPQI